MMKKSLIIIGFALASWGGMSTHSQNESIPQKFATHNKSSDNEVGGVHLVTKLLGKERIEIDDELFGIKLELQLEFTNPNDQVILLYKDYSVSHFWIAKNPEEMVAKKFEISSSLSHVPERNLRFDDLCLTNFVILDKGKSYRTQEFLTVFVSKSSKTNVQGSIVRGDHVMQIALETWEWSDKEAKELQEKFGVRGKVQTKPVVSNPISFTTE